MSMRRLHFEALKTHQILGVRTDLIDGIFERKTDKDGEQIVIVVNSKKAAKKGCGLMTFYPDEDSILRIEGGKK